MEITATVSSDCIQSGSPQVEISKLTGHKCNVEGQTKIELPPEKINWINTLPVLVAHLITLYVFKLLLNGRLGLTNVTVCLLLVYLGFLGTTVGAHRLWSHRSFKAKKPLRYFLAICQTFAAQGSILHWVTWHRVHHKYSDTELDPHNASRGFFYSHIGWLMLYNPKRFAVQRSLVPLDDVKSDSVVVWQDKYYDWLLLLGGLGTAFIPWWFFGEELVHAIYTCVCVRITLIQHITFVVNSFAHLYGFQPYDGNICPRENKIVSWIAWGEGWHNYHHTFPWDYRASEFGWSGQFNLSAAIIDFFARMGWAYDLKTASAKLVAARINRTGKS